MRSRITNIRQIFSFVVRLFVESELPEDKDPRRGFFCWREVDMMPEERGDASGVDSDMTLSFVIPERASGGSECPD